ncbi:hypothetical protein IAT38_001471 [Cryptococcus sp. DSM 104549]
MPEQVAAAGVDADEVVDFVRVYNPETDAQVVKMLVGQGVMEGLALSNRKLISHPVLLIPALLVGLAINHLLSFYPSSSNPLTYITPLIGPCLAFLPLMGIVEYLHRPGFTAALRKTIGAVDMVNPGEYYGAGSGGSGLWVFQHKGEVIGTLALDTKSPGEALGSVLGAEEGQMGDKKVVDQLLKDKVLAEKQERREGLRKRVAGKNTASAKDGTRPAVGGKVAQIRHFDVDQPLRGSGVGSELLLTALDHAFSHSPSSPSSTSIDRVIVHTNPLGPNERLFERYGFTPVSKEEVEEGGWEVRGKVGLLGWEGRWLVVERGVWAERREVVLSKGRK